MEKNTKKSFFFFKINTYCVCLCVSVESCLITSQTTIVYTSRQQYIVHGGPLVDFREGGPFLLVCLYTVAAKKYNFRSKCIPPSTKFRPLFNSNVHNVDRRLRGTITRVSFSHGDDPSCELPHAHQNCYNGQHFDQCRFGERAFMAMDRGSW